MMYILIALYEVLLVSGVILVKLGGVINAGIEQGFFNLHINYLSIIGLTLYICSFLVYQKIITAFNLSVIVPILVGISPTILLLAAFLIFKEEIGNIQLIGISLVIFGVMLINIRNSKMSNTRLKNN